MQVRTNRTFDITGLTEEDVDILIDAIEHVEESTGTPLEPALEDIYNRLLDAVLEPVEEDDEDSQ